MGEAIGRLESLKANDSAGTPLDTQVQIIISIPVIQETIKSLNLKDSKGNLLKETLPGKLKVEGIKGTDVVKIAYTDQDPQVAAKVVNKSDLERQKAARLAERLREMGVDPDTI